MKIQIGKFSCECSEEDKLPEVLEYITNLLIAEGWTATQLVRCLEEELERIKGTYKYYEGSGN